MGWDDSKRGSGQLCVSEERLPIRLSAYLPICLSASPINHSASRASLINPYSYLANLVS
jgi:hypothetical protein